MITWIARLFLVLAAAILAWELSEATDVGEWRLFVFGEVLFRLAPESLNLVQAIIQRYLFPWLWDPAIQTALLWPAWPVLGGVGAALYLAGRIRRR